MRACAHAGASRACMGVEDDEQKVQLRERHVRMYHFHSGSSRRLLVLQSSILLS